MEVIYLPATLPRVQSVAIPKNRAKDFNSWVMSSLPLAPEKIAL